MKRRRKRKPLPAGHLAPRTGGLRNVDAGAAGFRVKTGLLRTPLAAWRDRLVEAYWAQPSAKGYQALIDLEAQLGAWISTPGLAFDRFIVLNAASDKVPREHTAVPAWGSPLAWMVEAPSALYRMHSGLKMLGVAVGGIGDMVIFSQVIRQLRAKGVDIDVAHHGTPSAVLFERLFAPGKVQSFPLRQDILGKYDGFFPLGMHRVIFGEQLSDYTRRIYGVHYEPTGFDVSDEMHEEVARKLRFKHGFDLSRPLVFVQARGKGAKHYPGLEQVALRLSERHQVAIIGASGDSTVTDREGALANLCGWSLWDTLVAMHHAGLHIGPDSAFMHVAGALQKPSLALFGPSPRFWASPYPTCTTVSFAATCRFHPCWVMQEETPPCGTRVAPCLTQILPEEVVALAERKLRGDLGEHQEIARIPQQVVVQRRS